MVIKIQYFIHSCYLKSRLCSKCTFVPCMLVEELLYLVKRLVPGNTRSWYLTLIYFHFTCCVWKDVIRLTRTQHMWSYLFKDSCGVIQSIWHTHWKCSKMLWNSLQCLYVCTYKDTIWEDVIRLTRTGRTSEPALSSDKWVSVVAQDAP